MKKHLIYFILIAICTSCSLVSKQYYYVPASAHTTIKDRAGYFKMLRSQVDISDSLGKSIGSVVTSNGIGVTLLAGPPYVPVFPVGLVSVFYKGETQFVMDIDVRVSGGYLMPLATDSNIYKKTSDSLTALGRFTAAHVNTNNCYMIVNGKKKIPLQIKEFGPP